MNKKKLEDLRVLSLDDDDFMLEIISLTLNQIGVNHVETRNTAKSALDYLKEHGTSVDVFFCDLFMPDMDGIELLPKLVENGFKGSVVVLSGADKRIVNTMLELAKANNIDISGHLEKPVKKEDLRVLLENLIR